MINIRKENSLICIMIFSFYERVKMKNSGHGQYSNVKPDLKIKGH